MEGADEHLERVRRYLRMAIETAREGVGAGRGGPFGAVVVGRDEAGGGDRVLARACNRVTSANDPTAHAEVLAIREACARRGSFQLDGCELFASCEPCPMCLGAIYWARPEAVYFAATRETAAEAGFDDAFIYRELARDPEDRSIPFRPIAVSGSNGVFELWRSKPDRVDY